MIGEMYVKARRICERLGCDLAMRGLLTFSEAMLASTPRSPAFFEEVGMAAPRPDDTCYMCAVSGWKASLLGRKTGPQHLNGESKRIGVY